MKVSGRKSKVRVTLGENDDNILPMAKKLHLAGKQAGCGESFCGKSESISSEKYF